MISASIKRLLERLCILHEIFLLFMTITLNMTDVIAQSSLSMPICNKDWPGIRVNVLAFDFDGTCTVHDTTGLYYKASDKYRNVPDNEAKILDQEWESMGTSYLRGCQETITRLLGKIPPQENGYSNIQGLRQFLTDVHKFECQSTERVEASGLLAGISKEGIEQVAKEVELRSGCIAVLEQLNLPLHVISFNWSKDLIQTVLSQLKHLRIIGNRFPTMNDSTTGKVDDQVSSPLDKEAAFASLGEASQDRETTGVSVFIGDSIGDLLALLKADIGIVIGKSSTMRKICKSFGIRVMPLSDLYSSYHYNDFTCNASILNMKTADKKVLFETNSWQDIGELLLGSRLVPLRA